MRQRDLQGHCGGVVEVDEKEFGGSFLRDDNSDALKSKRQLEIKETCWREEARKEVCLDLGRFELSFWPVGGGESGHTGVR
jgi:hypothetical protein